MSTFYKDGYFWRTHSPDWELEKYGFRPNGCGDLIFNTCAKIIDDNDTSEWADDAIIECGCLLEDGMRWPDYMNSLFHDANNRLQWWWSKLKYKLGIREGWMVWNEELGEYELKIRLIVMYRPQNDLTRDPFIAFFTAVTLRDNIISTITIPWYLFRPTTWIWRRYLITGKGLWLYYFLTLRQPKQDYVKRLRRYMDMAVHYKLNT